MSYKLHEKVFDKFLSKLSKDFEIWAPKRFVGKGRFSDTDYIKYDKVTKFSDMELKEKSNASAKEVIIPITQSIFFFNKEGYTVPSITDKKILIFARPCDINAVDKLDTIYIENGQPDFYYNRLREKVKFAVIECTEGFENCFCVSMNSNKTQNYSLGFRFKDDKILMEVKDDSFNEYLPKEELIDNDFKVEFIKENKIKVDVPNVNNIDPEIFKNELWSAYDRCINCGRCTLNCPTCSCFTTSDLYYTENKEVGERRRVWASCHIDKYTDMAGGHSFRDKARERGRFKVLHKMYDFNKRFNKGHMCVGCGRCEDQCPEYISYIKVVNTLSKVLKEDE